MSTNIFWFINSFVIKEIMVQIKRVGYFFQVSHSRLHVINLLKLTFRCCLINIYDLQYNYANAFEKKNTTLVGMRTHGHRCSNK